MPSTPKPRPLERIKVVVPLDPAIPGDSAIFAAYQVYLHFDSDTSITIEGGFRLGADESTEPPVVHSELMRLVELVVSQVEWDPDGTLKLLFQDGQSLTVYDDQPAYESYRIATKGRTIIV